MALMYRRGTADVPLYQVLTCDDHIGETIFMSEQRSTWQALPQKYQTAIMLLNAAEMPEPVRCKGFFVDAYTLATVPGVGDKVLKAAMHNIDYHILTSYLENPHGHD